MAESRESGQSYQEEIDAFLAAGGSIDEPVAEEGQNRLHLAVIDGDKEKVRILLAAGANVNARTGIVPCDDYDPCDWWRSEATPLHLAAYPSHYQYDIEVARILLAAGADPNAEEHNGATPLYWAVRAQHIELVKILLSSGLNVATINDKSNYGRTPLHSAVTSSRRDVNIVRVLLAAGAYPNARDNWGITPLYNSGRAGSREIFRLLLEHGANPFLPNYRGETPLDHIIKDTPPWQELVERSLHLGPPKPGAVEVNCDNWHDYAFFYSVTAADVKECLMEGANPNARDPDGFTPLHEVAMLGDLAGVQALLEAGANVNARGEPGYTPLHWAAREGHPQIVKALLAAGAKVDAGSKIYNFTPLHLAADQGSAVSAKLLLEAGANANAYTLSLEPSHGLIDSWSRISPLHIAAYEGHANVISVLVTNGANIEARDDWGFTPLMRAVKKEHSGAIEGLLEAGASPVVQDNHKLLALTDMLDDDSPFKESSAYRKLAKAVEKLKEETR